MTASQSCRTCRWAEWPDDHTSFDGTIGVCYYPPPPLPECICMTVFGINPEDGANCPCWEEKANAD